MQFDLELEILPIELTIKTVSSIVISASSGDNVKKYSIKLGLEKLIIGSL
uniref:Uncharacterized protein n=1 Tax=Rhizophagus irregularis (strain DAOM 181602 / DAOM 197198 / MUCL 43194) TaxID=747089 RepID=U9TT85_RHIID